MKKRVQTNKDRAKALLTNNAKYFNSTTFLQQQHFVANREQLDGVSNLEDVAVSQEQDRFIKEMEDFFNS